MNNINKSNWKSFSFEQIASNISERIEPGETNLSIYVGLEHLDSDTIHINRFGNPSDVKGTKLKFYKGDMIFGKRRAYQRKAGLAELDGICSAHAMVLRANKNVIIPELFPFLLHSDVFMNKAIDISEGSLSPTIKWKTLAKQTFTIPPLDQQKKIADLLWSGDMMIQNRKKILDTYMGYRLSSYKKLFHNNEKKNQIKDLPIKIITGLWKGKSNDLISVCVIRNTEFDHFGELNLSKLQEISVDRGDYEKKALFHEDIIVEMSGGSDDQPVGRVVWFSQQKKPFSFSNFTKTIRIVNKEIVLPKYLFYYLLFCYEKGLTSRLENQTTGIRNLDFERYMKIFIPLVSIKEQQNIIDRLDLIESTRREIRQLIIQEETLLRNFVNMFIG